VWNLALQALVVRDALWQGVPGVPVAVSFCDLVHGADRWKDRREAAHLELPLPRKPSAALVGAAA